MWNVARIGQGKHQKAWKQESRWVHNSNPLQYLSSHVLFSLRVYFVLVFYLSHCRNIGWCRFNSQDTLSTLPLRSNNQYWDNLSVRNRTLGFVIFVAGSVYVFWISPKKLFSQLVYRIITCFLQANFASANGFTKISSQDLYCMYMLVLHYDPSLAILIRYVLCYSYCSPSSSEVYCHKFWCSGQ